MSAGEGGPLRVVSLDDHQDAARRFGPWAELGGDVELDAVREHLEGAELIARLRGAPVVVAMRERTAFGEEQFAALPELQLLVSTGPVNAAIDLDAAHRHGVTVCGTGITESPTAELTWGLVLALLRGIPAEQESLRAGRWQVGVGADLAGRTLGVLGLGNLGTRVARVGLAFGMEVIAWSQHLDAERARSLGVEPVAKADLLRRSDVLTVHVKLSERTRGLLGAGDLALLKPTAVLVNTSRGPVVETAALVAALHAGRLAGAALDVYDTEPLPAGDPLRAAPNTLLTPHVGYVTEETYRVFFTDAVEDVAAWRAGNPVRVLTAPGTPPPRD